MSEWLMGQLALIAVLGIAAQWLAWRMKLPAILLLLLVGLAAGPAAEAMGLGRLLDPDKALGPLLPPAVAQDPSAIARFNDEVRLARQVSHPNVCRVYDLGEVDGAPYISMEYVDGEDLGTLLSRIGRVQAGPPRPPPRRRSCPRCRSRWRHWGRREAMRPGSSHGRRVP